MAMCVCHMEKYGRSAIRNIEKHNTRAHDIKTNPDYKPDRTKDNFDLIPPPPTSYLGAIDDLVGKLPRKKKVRKDAVLMCSFIVGASPEFFKTATPEDQKRYFEDSVKFFQQRYGAENVIAATAHYDEVTPHAHICVVPIIDGRLSARDLFNRKELRSLQTDFAAEVGKRFGLDRGKEGSDARHLSELEYKTAEKEKELEAARQEIAEKEKKAEGVSAEIEIGKKQIAEMKKEVDVLKGVRDRAKTFHETVAVVSALGDAAKPQTFGSGFIVPRDLWTKAQIALDGMYAETDRARRAEAEARAAEKIATDRANRAERERDEARDEVGRLRDLLRAARETIKKYARKATFIPREIWQRATARYEQRLDLSREGEQIGEFKNLQVGGMFDRHHAIDDVFVCKGLTGFANENEPRYYVFQHFERSNLWTKVSADEIKGDVPKENKIYTLTKGFIGQDQTRSQEVAPERAAEMKQIAERSRAREKKQEKGMERD